MAEKQKIHTAVVCSKVQREKSSHNTTVLPSSTLHYRTESSQSETVLGTKPKITKLHEDEAGTSAEKTRKEHKAQEKTRLISWTSTWGATSRELQLTIRNKVNVCQVQVSWPYRDLCMKLPQNFCTDSSIQFNSIYFVFDRSKGVVNPQDIEHVNI